MVGTKLGKHNSCALTSTVFIQINRFKKEFYGNSISVKLSFGSYNTILATKYALYGLRKTCRDIKNIKWLE
ncbi:MAG: hypothetical protein M3421_06520 [Bacteroidota bacterium]|nr:hypothetical protein [Bacteroidota bacterium]